MGVHAVLRTEAGEQIRGIADPAGGTFDAAGDFDDAITSDERLVVLKLVDPYGETAFDASQMSDLLVDIERLRDRDLQPVERRGLARLEVMAMRCRDGARLQICFVGD